MNRRLLVCVVFATIAAMQLAAQTSTAKPKSAAVPRAADGHADLTGIWANATITPLERAANVNGKATLTDAEAKVIEKAAASELQNEDGGTEGPLLAGAGSAGTGAYNLLFFDRGSELARVDGVKRTSLIIDPPDGHIPFTAEAKQRQESGRRGVSRFDSVFDRPLGERCIIGFGSTSGPPMLPVLYNNNYQIVQTKDAVMIMIEMVHDIRIVRINGTHAPPNVRELLGDSIGHWEGDTLVIDTTNFTDQTRFRGSSANLHVIERLRRVDGNTILYRATIEDPTAFAKPWTIEYPFLATAGPIYEYACHEGNYAMDDILGGARKTDTDKK